MEDTHAVALTTIGQIAIPVQDLERAVDFYSNVLKMRHLFTVTQLAFYDCDGIRLMLSVPETAEVDHPASVIYYRVADIQTAFETLSARGVQFVDAPHIIADMGSYTLWMAFFHDSEHNLLGIMSEVPKT